MLACSGADLARRYSRSRGRPALRKEGRVTMTDIDPRADIELHPANEHVTVRVPLAGQVTSEWLGCYQKLALASEVPAQAQADQDRAWIVVNVPASSAQGDVVATMDAARALIAEADAAARTPATETAEASVRGWWAGRRASAPGRPVSGTGAAGVGAEKRWPMAVTLVLALAVPLLLPARFSLGPSWAVPVVEALLLVAIVAIDRGRIDRRSAAGRALSLVLVAVLVEVAARLPARRRAAGSPACRRAGERSSTAGTGRSRRRWPG